MSPFAEDFVITDIYIYICSLKQQYLEICVKMQQYLCELHLCMDGCGGECGLVIMKRIACQGILKQIFFNAKIYICGDGGHFYCQSGCPEQVYSQRIYPGCSYGGNAHWSGGYGDDYGCCVGDESFRDGNINNGKRFPFVYDRRHNFCVSLNQKLGKRVDLSAIWSIASGNWEVKECPN